MKQKLWDNILMTVTGISFFVNIFILNVYPPANKNLIIIGYIILSMGVLLFFISLLTLLKNKSGQLIQTGIYGLVRHPMYLAAIIMFISHIFFGQHWIVFISAAVGIICCYLIILSGDQRNLKKFGQSYQDYMNSVPRVNVVWGVIRQLRADNS